MTREEAKKILKRIVNTSNELTHPVMLNTEIEAIKVAIEALSDVPYINVGKWIPITSRPMDKEEREEWSDKLGYELDDEEAVIYGSLPDDGQMVLVCYKYGSIAMDTFCQDECGCYFEENGEMDGIVAWMLLPEPYKENES